MTKKGVASVDPQDILRRNNHNQRLEFLGDAVLEAIVSTNLFLTVIYTSLIVRDTFTDKSQQLPEHREGILTQYRSAVVNNDNLSHIAVSLHLDRYLMFVPETAKVFIFWLITIEKYSRFRTSVD